MSLSEKITHVLNGTIDSVNTIIPAKLDISKPSMTTQPLQQSSIGVLIGMTGDVRGRIVIVSDEPTLSNVGELMFGMPLEGEMLQSFTGELGNMLAGNIATNISSKGMTTDITPPTVMVGETKMYGFDRAFRVPVKVEDKGELHIILMLEPDNKH
ncbi:chemotaxis protein CheX [Bacillus solimangrovi]|uniref:Chemotaxis protein CheX n=1 Tax=Bacillus solimangrovi TaxID=1305675 RepID=A0A1E5LFY2_9BACI|nr:chemotaxis protein CheX [Bacillus solimangrovi]OEH92980.1 chemotaxis protein CheX [Bacillus solimangrovi]